MSNQNSDPVIVNNNSQGQGITSTTAPSSSSSSSSSSSLNNPVAPVVGANTPSGPMKLFGIQVPRVGDTVYIYNKEGSFQDILPELGTSAFVFEAKVLEYPAKRKLPQPSSGPHIYIRHLYELVNVRIVRFLQPSSITDSLRQKIGTDLTVPRLNLSYYELYDSHTFPVVGQDNYRAYLQTLRSENQDPTHGGKSHKKRKLVQYKKRKLSKKQTKKSQKRKR